jgi:hypothetical protein
MWRRPVKASVINAQVVGIKSKVPKPVVKCVHPEKVNPVLVKTYALLV